MSGKISFCGTPIGNLEDITLRVLKTLEACDVVYAEDTRHSVRLLNHFEISKPLHSYHEHNRFKVGPEIIEKALKGEAIALITDAGMPGISDPGEDLVKLCIESGVAFEVVPGVTAFTTALVGSGLSTKTFAFEGFLSRDKKQRKETLNRIKDDPRTLLFYESPHRLKQTLKVLIEALGDRTAVVARELTKKYETFQRGHLSDLMAFYEGIEIKGEIVLVVSGHEAPLQESISFDVSIKEAVMALLETGLSKKEAMKEVAKERGLKKSDVYAELIEE